MSSDTNKIERRQFLTRLSLLASSAAVAGLLPGRAIAAGANVSELSASAAVEAMRNGDMKAEDYARVLLDRARELAHLNAFRTLNREMVLEAARAADKTRASGAALGMLHGLPIPVKDSVNTKDLPTSNGTRALRDFKPRDDAAVLKPLFAQGAILMGKTNLHELSYGWTSNNATLARCETRMIRSISPAVAAEAREPLLLHELPRSQLRRTRSDQSGFQQACVG